jgi:hypothetical protein
MQAWLCGDCMAALVTCPFGNTDYNAIWPSGVLANSFIEGSYCKPGWTGNVGRQCLQNGQWANSLTGSCTRMSHLGPCVVCCLPQT